MRPAVRIAVVVASLAGTAVLAGGSPRAAAQTASNPPVFDAGLILQGQGGGEPSLAVDLSSTPSRGDVYVAAIGGWGSSPPQGDPSGAGPVIWHSDDGGRTF